MVDNSMIRYGLILGIGLGVSLILVLSAMVVLSGDASFLFDWRKCG